MANPLTTARNDYHNNPKNSAVPTPLGLSQFIFDMTSSENLISCAIDLAVGEGNLLKPWYINNYDTLGVDNFAIRRAKYCKIALQKNTFELLPSLKFFAEELLPINMANPIFVLNPPFNTDDSNKEWLKKNKLGKVLLPELFFTKIYDNFPHNTKLALFAPMGFYFNQRIHSKRWRMLRDIYSDVKLTGFTPLPLDIFPGVEFHVGLFFFNLEMSTGQFCNFLGDEYIE